MTIVDRVRSLPSRIKRGAQHFVDGFLRVPGGWYLGDLVNAAAAVQNVKGDFIELGVWHGNTFRKLVPLAEQQEKIAHAVDSFEGMAPPSKYDVRPAGDLSIGGVSAFHANMRRAGISEDRYQTHVGFIPAVFQLLNAGPFSFAVVDLDNYNATADAIAWLWPRMSNGGIVAFDDFWPTGEVEATRAIKEFLSRESDYFITGFQNYQLYVRKIASAC